jgi:hypothetical protein
MFYICAMKGIHNHVRVLRGIYIRKSHENCGFASQSTEMLRSNVKCKSPLLDTEMMVYYT